MPGIRANDKMKDMTIVLALVVLALCLWVGGAMALRPEEYLRAKRERAPQLLRGLTARLSQPTPANVWLTRIAGVIIVGVGLLSAGLTLLR